MVAVLLPALPLCLPCRFAPSASTYSLFLRLFKFTLALVCRLAVGLICLNFASALLQLLPFVVPILPDALADFDITALLQFLLLCLCGQMQLPPKSCCACWLHFRAVCHCHPVLSAADCTACRCKPLQVATASFLPFACLLH